MEESILIRALDFRDYSVHNKRFRHQDVFDPYEGGVSTFLEDCAVQKSQNIYSHIDRYYSNTVTFPVFYWKLSTTDVIASEGLSEVEFVDTPSSPNNDGETDDCHRDIQLKDVDEKVFRGYCRNFAKNKCLPDDVFICLNGISHQLTQEQHDNLHDWLKSIGITIQ